MVTSCTPPAPTTPLRRSEARVARWGACATYPRQVTPAALVQLVGGCVVLGAGVSLLLAPQLGSDGFSSLVSGLAEAAGWSFMLANAVVSAGVPGDGLAARRAARDRHRRPGRRGRRHRHGAAARAGAARPHRPGRAHPHAPGGLPGARGRHRALPRQPPRRGARWRPPPWPGTRRCRSPGATAPSSSSARSSGGSSAPPSARARSRSSSCSARRSRSPVALLRPGPAPARVARRPGRDGPGPR